MFYILDANGEPEKVDDILAWGRFMERADRTVAKTMIDDVAVSTVFMGLDHNHARTGKPVLWETMVFGGRLDGECDRYTNRIAALVGHEVWVAAVKHGYDVDDARTDH